ncbi:MAG: type II secretion system protein N [Wenzhouxiangella sp.]
MARVLGLIALGVLALLLVLILTLPASLLLQIFDAPEPLQRGEGTVWSGQARWMQSGQQPLPVRWRWRGGLLWEWQASDGVTMLEGTWRPAGGLYLPEVRGQLAMERVDLGQWLRVSRPLGVLELALTEVQLAEAQLPRAQGAVHWREAALAGAIQESLGEIRLRPVGNGQALRIEVESLQPAPIMVRGELRVEIDHYQLDLWLRAERARPELQMALRDLGELQPDGQVRLQIRGMTGF